MTQLLKALNIFFCIALLLTPLELEAKRSSPIIIRDAEIEGILEGWLAPLLHAAGMPENSVNLVLVQDPALNAFVAGGANIFIYTGLIDRTENPGELIGVMAHELGHIDGSHLISSRTAMQKASYESILGMVIGIGAAILSGKGDAAGAIIYGSNSLAERGFLATSRIYESSADQAALRLMKGAQINPKGLETFFDKLGDQDLLSSDKQSEYVRTHPLTRNRIDAVKANVAKSPYLNKAFPAQWIEDHKRMKAKLTGFITPGRVAWDYDDRDKSFAADYARAIAAYRESHVTEAISIISELIKREPNNAWLYELKGQMLTDFGRVKEALSPLRTAVKLAPNSGLLQISLGHALVETQDFNGAIKLLEPALQKEPRSARARRLLATSYGRLGQEGMAKIHLAEEAILRGRKEDAMRFARAVIATEPENSRPYRLAGDIIAHLKTLK